MTERNISLTEAAKLKRLRSAVQEGLDQIDRGDGVRFRSMKELDAQIDELGKEASVGFWFGKPRGY